MGLKIGEKMHLMDIDENTLVWDNIFYTLKEIETQNFEMFASC
jgi:hypothetical protein